MRKISKLTVTREAIRTLTVEETATVAGGRASSSGSRLPTFGSTSLSIPRGPKPESVHIAQC
jgi:hypothetical protein